MKFYLLSDKKLSQFNGFENTKLFAPSFVGWLIFFFLFIIMFVYDSVLYKLNDDILWLNFIALAALMLLLSSLKRTWKQTLWIWITLIVFVFGYFYKTFWFGNNVELLSYFSLDYAQISINEIIDAYYWITLSFVVFCLSAWWVLNVGAIPGFIYKYPEFIRCNNVKIRYVVLLVLVMGFLSLILGVIRALLGLKIMGAEAVGGQPNVVLPFHLEQIILRFQSNLIPALLLLAVWIMDDQKRKVANILSIGVLLLHYTFLTVITTSRAGLILFSLHLFFLWWISGKFTKSRLYLIMICLALTIVIIYPLMTTLRTLRAAEMELGEGLEAAYNIVSDRETEVMLSSSFYIIQKLIDRFTGADGVWFSQKDIGGFPIERLLRFRTEPISKYYTQEVVMVINPNTLMPPGLTGTGLLLGGLYYVIGIWIFFVFYANCLWKWLSSLKAAPVCLTIGAIYLWIFMQGGMFDYRDTVTFFISVFVVELLYRIVLTSKTINKTR